MAGAPRRSFQVAAARRSARRPVVVAMRTCTRPIRRRGAADLAAPGTGARRRTYGLHLWQRRAAPTAPVAPVPGRGQRTVRCSGSISPAARQRHRELATAILGEQPSEPTGRNCHGVPVATRSTSRRSWPPVSPATRSPRASAMWCSHAARPRSRRHPLVQRRPPCRTGRPARPPSDDRARPGEPPGGDRRALPKGFLVDDPEGFRFRHDLVREVFLDELLPGERTALFARAAAALERHQPPRLGGIARLHSAGAQLGGAAGIDAAAPPLRRSARWRRRAKHAARPRIGHRVDRRRSWRRVRISSCSVAPHAPRICRVSSTSAVELGRIAAARRRTKIRSSKARRCSSSPSTRGTPATRPRRCHRPCFAGAPSRAAKCRARPDGDPPRQPAPPAGRERGGRGLLPRAADTAVRSVIRASRPTLGRLSARPRGLRGRAALAKIYAALALATERTQARSPPGSRQPFQHLVFMGRFRRGGPTRHRWRQHCRTLRVLALHGILLQGNGLEALEPLGRWTRPDDRRGHRSSEWRRQRAPMGVGARRLGADRDPSG